jgi:hypothetical protein
MPNCISHETDVQTKKPVKPVEVFGITNITMTRLLTQKNPANLIALYCFLLATANRQRTQIVFANEWFIGQALKWSEAKVSYVKKQLRGLKLIETIARRDAKGRVQKHYVRLAFSADIQSLKIQSLKKPVGGKIGDNAYEIILNASEGMDAYEIKSKDVSGFTAGFSPKGESAVPEGEPAASKKKTAAVWKPDTRPQWEKLDALRPPRDFPTECEFDEHLDVAGLHLVQTYRTDLYRELCGHKWRDWNKRTQKWELIRDWRKYVAALDEKIFNNLGSGRKADAAAPEVKSPAAVPAAAVVRPAAVVHQAAVAEPPDGGFNYVQWGQPAVVRQAAVAEPPRVAKPAACPPASATPPAVKPAEMRPAMASTTATATESPAPRPAYREPQAVAGDEIPDELETENAL